MIGRIRGQLVAIVGEKIMVDVAGVGYEIAMTPTGLADLPPIGEEVVVHTHLQVREDDLSLYGFVDSDSSSLFKVLLSAAGIGPKVALALLSTHTPNELRRAIVTEDAGALSMAPGVGKRTAQKMILELLPKIADAEAEVVSGSGQAQVRQALENLGYRSEEIGEVVTDPFDDVATQLKSALKQLGQS